EVNVELAPVSSSNLARTCLKAVCGAPVHTATTLMLWPERSGSPVAPDAPDAPAGGVVVVLLPPPPHAAATRASTPKSAMSPTRRRPFRIATAPFAPRRDQPARS